MPNSNMPNAVNNGIGRPMNLVLMSPPQLQLPGPPSSTTSSSSSSSSTCPAPRPSFSEPVELQVSVPKEAVDHLLKSGDAWVVTESEKKTRSDVWKYFGRVQLADGRYCRDVVACMGCLMVYMYRSKSQGTSTLRHHKCEYVFQVLQTELQMMRTTSGFVTGRIVSIGDPHPDHGGNGRVVALAKKRATKVQDGGSGGGTTPDGRREMTPEADNMDRKPVMPTPPPLKEHLMSSPPPQHHPPGHMPQLSGSGGRGIHNHLGTPPPPVSSSSSQHHQNHHNHHPSSLGGGGGGGGSSGSNGGGRSSTPINNHSHSSVSSASPPQQLLCVRWGNFDSNIVSMFTKLRTAEHFVDATLWCEGKTIKCHKMILSACSTYFEKLLTENPNPHPIIFLKDMRFWEITALVEFMYKGEVSIHQEKLQSLLRAAESLQIKGLGSPSANDGPGGIGNATEPMDRSRHHSGVDADDSMDMSTTTATPNNNSSLATSHLQSNPFSNQILNSFNTSRGSPSLLHMNMGMDLSSRSSTGDHPSPLSLSLSSNNNNNNNTSNPAKRRKKENPRRLDILPTRTSMPIPVFNSTIMSMPVDHHHQHHNDDEYDAEPPSDDEMTIHENDGPPHHQQQQQQRPHIIENFKQEPDSLLQHHQHIGKLGGLPQHQHPSSYEEDEDEGDGQENYGDHHQDGGVGAGGLQMDETKSDSEGEADGEEPSPEDEENSTIDHQQIQSQQGYDEETDESGALSLRVASAAERERLEREQRSRKGNPIKKILVGNINNNNNNNNNESGSIFHSPTSAAE